MISAKILSLLVQLYGEESAASVSSQLLPILREYRSRLPPPHVRVLTERDAILITYPDQVQESGQPPLRTLAEFCKKHILDTISGIHILPFYPWSSDDGFSVVDYRAVDERYGKWEDVQALGRDFRLMFDAVINHISIQSAWFQGMLRGEERFREYFVIPQKDADLTGVVRPRVLPLLTGFRTAFGDQNFWTTFSTDQVDLNYKNPVVLLEIIDILLSYVERGAEFIRLDAIAYLWKEPGTACIHLPQTHTIIQLFRSILDELAPSAVLITESNVPHADNISYFGDGTNEAQMVYNFTLPPLVLHAIHAGSSEILTRWAAGLDLPPDKVTYFNFLASHDGIGLNPLNGILSESEIEEVIGRARAHGGLVSFKSEPDGSSRPYELNINYFDALNDPNAGEPLEIQCDRFIAAHAILLALRGVPGIYFHSLFGSRGWPDGIMQTGRDRTINREKLIRTELEVDLSNPDSMRARVFGRLSSMLKVRASSPAFHPFGYQRIMNCSRAIFAVLREAADGGRVLCLHNVSDGPSSLEVNLESMFGLDSRDEKVTELISGRRLDLRQGEALWLAPYQVMWLAKQ